MSLRKGKTKSILENSIDSALLAVEIYNKPRTRFRVENYIILMIIAWTRLFHAHFNNTIGSKYFYKEGSRYKRIDGEKKAWEIKTCMKKYGKLSKAEEKNLNFFIKLRNKIEHRHIEKETLGTLIFGECQALLYNFENTLIKLFGNDYSINENLAFSLQFSKVMTKEQKQAQKSLLSREVKSLVEYINKYRNELSDEVFNSQEYSIKFIAIPKVANASRNDLSVEFLKWNSLTNKEKQEVQKLTAIIKDKVVKVEGSNTNRYRPSVIVNKVVKSGICDFNISHHTSLWKLFEVRPQVNSEDPFDTNTEFCYYDEAHDDYLYTEKWVDFLINIILSKKIKLNDLSNMVSNKQYLNINDFKL